MMVGENLDQESDDDGKVGKVELVKDEDEEDTIGVEENDVIGLVTYKGDGSTRMAGGVSMSRKAHDILVKRKSFMGVVNEKLNLDSFEVPGREKSIHSSSICEENSGRENVFSVRKSTYNNNNHNNQEGGGNDIKKPYKFRFVLTSVVIVLSILLCIGIATPALVFTNNLLDKNFEQCINSLDRNSQKASELIAKLGKKENLGLAISLETEIQFHIFSTLLDSLATLQGVVDFVKRGDPSFTGMIANDTLDNETYDSSICPLLEAVGLNSMSMSSGLVFSNGQTVIVSSSSNETKSTFTFCDSKNFICNTYVDTWFNTSMDTYFFDYRKINLYTKHDSPQYLWSIFGKENNNNSSLAISLPMVTHPPLETENTCNNDGFCMDGVMFNSISFTALNCMCLDISNQYIDGLLNITTQSVATQFSPVFILNNGFSDDDEIVGSNFFTENDIIGSSINCENDNNNNNNNKTMSLLLVVKQVLDYFKDINIVKSGFGKFPLLEDLKRLPSGNNCTIYDLENDCYLITAKPVKSNSHDRIVGNEFEMVVVSVYPARIFLDTINEELANEIRQSEKLRQEEEMDWQRMVAVVCLISFFLLVVASLFTYWFARKFGSSIKLLSSRMSNVEKNLSFTKLNASAFSRIWEIREMQHSFEAMSDTIEVLSKFVPTSVIGGIVRNENGKGRRLHVDRKYVTIMFSDIQGFTSISEALDEQNLLYFLTKYLSVMTLITESYQGCVAEVLGDGLVCFWNTPDDCEQHEAKACACALAQQQAMDVLNEEFKDLLIKLGLSKFSIRIGIHTGKVLTGNIGSLTKMKFGCIGDAVNLASRMEGVCKLYGVSILCSQSTFVSLPKDSFVTRELDKVQVKGKNKPVRIYQVIALKKRLEERFSSTIPVVPSPQHNETNKLLNLIKGGEKNEPLIKPKKSREYGPVEFFESYKEESIVNYEEALRYYQVGKFEKAAKALEIVNTQHDLAAQLLKKRIDQAIEQHGMEYSGGSEWNGILKLDEKEF